MLQFIKNRAGSPLCWQRSQKNTQTCRRQRRNTHLISRIRVRECNMTNQGLPTQLVFDSVFHKSTVTAGNDARVVQNESSLNSQTYNMHEMIEGTR